VLLVFCSCPQHKTWAGDRHRLSHSWGALPSCSCQGSVFCATHSTSPYCISLQTADLVLLYNRLLLYIVRSQFWAKAVVGHHMQGWGACQPHMTVLQMMRVAGLGGEAGCSHLIQEQGSSHSALPPAARCRCSGCATCTKTMYSIARLPVQAPVVSHPPAKAVASRLLDRASTTQIESCKVCRATRRTYSIIAL
jgi:hypothetical protein